jgi:hypothetical protein
MQDPVRELPGLINQLLQSPAHKQRQLIERYFTPDCTLTHALVRCADMLRRHALLVCCAAGEGLAPQGRRQGARRREGGGLVPQGRRQGPPACAAPRRWHKGCSVHKGVGRKGEGLWQGRQQGGGGAVGQHGGTPGSLQSTPLAAS